MSSQGLACALDGHSHVCVLFFDSNAGIANAADPGSSLARPGRHSGGDNLAFVDGHVKWVAESGIQPNSFDPGGAAGAGMWGGGITPPLPAEQPPAPAEQPLPKTAALVGKPAPNFTLPSQEGEKIKLASFRGKPVVLFLMAHW